MANYVLDNILFNVAIEMNGENKFTISARASGVVTFEADVCYYSDRSKTCKEEFDMIYKAMKSSNITLSRMDLAQEYALGIYFEYTYTDKKGKVQSNGYELYYQPHFTIEEAIEDAMKVKYR